MDIINQLPCPVLITTGDGTVQAANIPLLTLVGKSQHDILQKNMDELLPLASRIFLQTHILPMLLRDGSVNEIHLKLKGKDNEPIAILLNCTAGIFEGNDCYIWIFFVVQERNKFEQELLIARKRTEVTNLELAEQKSLLTHALRNSSALLGTLDMHAIVSTADRAGNITEVNDAFCIISGFSREELIGKNHRIVNSGMQPREFWISMWESISHGKPWRGTICNRSKNGTHYWVDTFIAPFMDADGVIEKYISIRTDITAAKKQEAALIIASEQLLKAAEVAQLGIWTWNLTNNAITYDERMHEIYETPADLINSGLFYDDWRSRVHPDDIGFTEDKLHGAVAGIATYDPIFRVIRNDGSIRFIQASGYVERDINGKPVMVMGINRDITEQQNLESTLREAKQAADDASRSKSEFLANMSHEIRTPMNAILGMLTLLRKTELSIRQEDYASKTESAARSLLGLLNDILDISKVEAGKMELDPHPFYVDQLLGDLSVIFSANVGSKPIEVLFDIDPNVPRHLIGDAMRLQQVLINLGSNAIKFTPKGEVILKISVSQRIDSTVTLRFALRDSGIGIARENQARIFSGFTQAEASTTRRFGGTGLGVAISQSFVQLMGGELELQSALGEGSEFFFTITLPLADDTTPTPKMTSKLSSAPWRTLVVDDNPIANEILERMAQSLGWTVDVATSGEHAIELIQTQAAVGITYQAIFVDWQMPMMDGWQTSKHIHGLNLTNAMPVIVMVTAHGREMLIQRSEADQALIGGYLVKPITASMLLNAVEEARGGSERQHSSTTNGSTEKRLDGMRILLAEDNLNNQQIAQELLEAEGAILVIVNNGQEAVDAVANINPAFDVVLMDLQMPVMDGMTATQHIRHKLNNSTLPIIAMTANAMASDREACLKAGMNNHVGKPFDVNHLIDVLRSQVGWQDIETLTVTSAITLAVTSAVTSAVQASEASAEIEKAANAAGVDIVSAIHRLGGKQDLYLRMLPMFLKSLETMPEQLRAHLADGELKTASHVLHSLKGLAATMGVTALSAEAAAGEKLLTNETPRETAEQIVEHLCHAITTALPALKTLLARLQLDSAIVEVDITKTVTTDIIEAEKKANTLDTQALITSLQALAQQLQNSDMAAFNTLSALQNQFGIALNEQLKPLNFAINNLNFSQALLLCQELIHTHQHST